jgi:hypothetical protein
MRFLNEGRRDRSIRMLAGIVLVVAGWVLALNTPGVALFAIGAIALGTAIVGWCPAYTLFGISTVKTQRSAGNRWALSPSSGGAVADAARQRARESVRRLLGRQKEKS